MWRSGVQQLNYQQHVFPYDLFLFCDKKAPSGVMIEKGVEMGWILWLWVKYLCILYAVICFQFINIFNLSFFCHCESRCTQELYSLPRCSQSHHSFSVSLARSVNECPKWKGEKYVNEKSLNHIRVYNTKIMSFSCKFYRLHLHFSWKRKYK